MHDSGFCPSDSGALGNWVSLAYVREVHNDCHKWITNILLSIQCTCTTWWVYECGGHREASVHFLSSRPVHVSYSCDPAECGLYQRGSWWSRLKYLSWPTGHGLVSEEEKPLVLAQYFAASKSLSKTSLPWFLKYACELRVITSIRWESESYCYGCSSKKI